VTVSLLHALPRTDARVAEGSGLLSRRGRESVEGSNPSPSVSRPGSERAPYGERGASGVSDGPGGTRGSNAAASPLGLSDPLQGANCHWCGVTADNFHVSDELWAKVEPILGQHQTCFKCFRIAAWHIGLRPTSAWEVTVG
jgi:hypothetical protein